MATWGYARVSSRGQQRDGYGLDVQRQLLVDARVPEGNVVSEAFTGVSESRPALDALVERLAPGDTLVIPRVDRLARSSEAGWHIVERLVGRGVAVRLLDIGLFEDTPMGRYMLKLMLLNAELDHDMTVSRLASGLERAREADPSFRVGRKAKDVDAKRFSRLLSKVRGGSMTATDAARALGVSRSKWYRLVAGAA